VTRRLLENIAADERVHAEDLKLAVEIESRSVGRTGG
jgi:rubrerythrin